MRENENFIELMWDSAKKGDFNPDLQKICKFVNSCNPRVCFEMFLKSKKAFSAYILEHFDDLESLTLFKDLFVAQ